MKRRQKKSGKNSGNYIVEPSIRTYRDVDFDMTYQVNFHKGRSIEYETTSYLGSIAKKAHWDEMRIPHALQLLRWHFEALEELNAT